MTQSIDNWLEAHAPGDVRAFVNANQLRLTAQAETIGRLKADIARIAEILGPQLSIRDGDCDVDYLTPCIQVVEARELLALLGAGT